MRSDASTRHRLIIDSARELFRQEPGERVGTEAIAELAGVSPPTVYNLVGTREQLVLTMVHELLDTLADRVARSRLASPIDRGGRAVDIAVELFVADAPVHRYAIRRLGGWDHPARDAGGPRRDGAAVQLDLMAEAAARGQLRSELSSRQVARQIYVSFNGALGAWAVGAIDDAVLAAQASHGFWTTVAAATTDNERDHCLNRMRVTQRRLDRLDA